MAGTANINTAGVIQTLNGALPCEGPKALPFIMDFSAFSEFDIDLTQQYQQGQFTTLQAIYIDNSANGSTLTVTVNGTGQTIVAPKNSCGYYILLMPQPPKLAITTAGVVKVYVSLMNFYIPPYVWSVA